MLSVAKKLVRFYTAPVLLSWLIATLFLDVIAVPTVFRNISNVLDAGRVGMTIFKTFNRIEIIFAVIFLSYGIEQFISERKKKYLIFSIILFFWILIYNFYLTPSIIYYTEKLHSGVQDINLMIEYQSKHAFIHKTYRYLDSSKILILLGLIISLTRKNLKETK
jgi:hypothetical protein